ncbi:hypothetical protein BWZ20_02590 [Winogradskyella sp. J14-2]|uniref:hypothetical protein n=1 Tax=Winogradskyella sp. J14-2 TaxID=1936080 RepID=UPI000972E267|nr:hypothetical protein [Winogradskyella sp. J14-2]APY07258.1 hypothetical protein BWZ20_02590 [Winogradskyella sp. J14-2]
MAKQKGIVFFEGTLGGINFYYRKGVPTARRAGGGFTAKAIKHSPNMVRVRESNSEFALCSKINKYFKLALKPFLAGYKDGTLHARLMRLFLSIKDLDVTSERGQRTVGIGYATEYGPRVLSDFVVTPERPQLFSCSYTFDWAALRFNVWDFSVAAANFPKGADVMELVVGVLRFDFETCTYTSVMADALYVPRDFDASSFSISVDGLPDGDGVLVAVARVAFYQQVNGGLFLLSGAAGFGVAMFGCCDV